MRLISRILRIIHKLGQVLFQSLLSVLTVLPLTVLTFIFPTLRRRRFQLSRRLTNPHAHYLALEQDRLHLLLQLLQVTAESNGDPQVVYPLLQANIDQLDDNFIQLFQAWATETLTQSGTEQALFIAMTILDFSWLMQKFPLGRRALNIDIAMTGYRLVLISYIRDASPINWAITQHNLGNTYSERIRGDRAQNIELAIDAYQQALSIYTRDAFSVWAMTQNNLGSTYCERIQGDKAQNIELAIDAYQQALSIYTRDAFPVEWAMTQSNLGSVYRERIRGDRAQNIELAIDACQQALSIYTRDAFPVKWALAQYNLAIAYIERIQGNRAQNIELAIDAYQQALLVYTRDAFPVDWAITQSNLGAAYSGRIHGDIAQNLELAIDAHQQALSVYTRDASPVDWARTQYNLGIAYNKRRQGNRTQNLELAIDACLQALSVYTRDAFPVNWALTQTNLTTAYRNRIREDRAQNVELAIDACQQALSVFTRDVFPVDWALTQYNLGSAYSQRIRGDVAQNLELAINAFQQALSVYTRDAFPVDWAMTHNALGSVYPKRIRGDIAQNIELAINACQEALSVYTRDAFPIDWAMTHNNLGNAYRERIGGDRAQNIELAINAYQQALSIYTPDTFSVKWVMIQTNLSGAYRERIRGDRVQNIELAIDACQQALSVYTPDTFPVYYWVMIQNTLAIAYRNRIVGDKAQNLELSIDAYQQALSVCTRDAFPIDWAMIQNNLAAAYSQRIQGDKAQNLELAIDACQQALSVYTPDTSPVDWATTQNSLAAAYSDRIQGDRTQNLELAINACQQALSVYTRDAFPINWASTQHNLAIAYGERIQGDRAQNLELTIAAFKNALEIRTPTTLPLDCFQTAANLGNLAFEQGLWTTAVEGYEQAIEAIELTRTWLTSDADRQGILAGAITAYHNLVQALINIGQLQKAIKYVESSRSRQLVDLMASNHLYAHGEIPPQLKEYLQQFENLQQQINQEQKQLRNQSDINKEQECTVETFHETSRQHRIAFGATTEKLQRLEAEKYQVWEQMRRLDPVLAGQIQVTAPDFTTIQQLIDSPKTAILSFYTTNNDTYIFILSQNQSPQLHTCSGQGIKTLQYWIYDNWLRPYFANKATWVSQMCTFLQELASRLRINDLIAQHLQGIEEIILIPHLFLHQIPFAVLLVDSPQSPLTQPGQQSFLGDRFLIRYASSCQILEFCHNREDQHTLHETSLQYGIVENATDDLYFTTFECENIASLYPNNQRLQGSQQATVSNYQKLAKQVQGIHSSHHAYSRWDNPLESQLSLGDGSITLGELMSPRWRLPQLLEVFLSCCETNLGYSEITDDVLTLSSGFLCAGARSVISTLWAVDDLATALFSIFYYEYRQQGNSRAEAVRKSQVKLRTLSGETLKTLYYAELNPLLEMKISILEIERQQAESARKEAQSQRNQARGTAAYEQWDQEYKRVAKAAIALENSVKRYKSLYLEPLPFAHPRYWAAFTCQGLR
jgi:CHAT domain-containing protein/tetratricopeptide (TPR) repeat protein